MNIAAVKERLALIEAGGEDSQHQPVTGIANVKKAYANGPASLPDADLPLFVNFVGPTRQVLNIGGMFFRESRIFNCRLYVTPVQSGIDGEAEGRVEPFLDSGMQQFMAHQALGDGEPADLIEGIFKIEYTGDSGIQVMRYAGTDYLGVEFRVAVDAISEITPAPFE